MKAMDDESVDLIISNELFCDLDRKGLKNALKEFYRILKHNGQMAHGELNPVAENVAQRLVIEADSFSMETLTQKYEWFSPFSDEVVVLMHRMGFKDITGKYFERWANNILKLCVGWENFKSKHRTLLGYIVSVFGLERRLLNC
ncbi:MAG: class I SAM-dependent methyltransferase [Candidatus Bathyarchaeota archaeon]|nr:class I SAM-dependent methyltransferase [Candidatus Bathyarchaeota archaeon]